MKDDDLIRTASKQDEATISLLQTERKNAINSGIVASSDKSQDVLREELFDRSGNSNKLDATMVHAGKKDASFTNTNEKESLPIDNRERFSQGASRDAGASFGNDTDKYSGLAASNNLDKTQVPSVADNTDLYAPPAKGGGIGAKDAMRSILSRFNDEAFRDSELEEVKDMYRGTKQGARAAKNAYDRLKSVTAPTKNVLNSGTGNNSLGKLSQRKYKSPKNAKEVQRAFQMQRNQAMSRGIVNAKGAGAGMGKAAAAKGAGAAAGGAAAGGAAAAGGTAAAGGGAALPVIGVLLLVFLLVFCQYAALIVFGAGGTQEDVKELTGNEAIVASFLLGKGVDKLHTAAIMGNISAESSFDPGIVESNGVGYGICQWSFGRRTSLELYALSAGKPSNDITMQLEFLWAEMTGEGKAAAYSNVQYDHSKFLEITDLEEAVYYWGREFERPNELLAHWDRRIREAIRFFGSLYDSSGESRIALAKTHLGKPYVWGAEGPDEFDCSGFVYYVLNQSGYPIDRTTADVYYDRCTILPEKDARPGDLIFFCRTYETSELNGVSHIGFYMGDGMMVHAGEPVQVASFKTSYWQAHSPEFGRLP
jgi:cell wall-associated NlpC family hydrolase